MSKLYLSGKTDKKANVVAGAHKYIDLNLGFDESNYNRVINVRFNVPSDTNNPTLWIAGEKACEVKGNVLICNLKKINKTI